jgi:hypothetical protein
VTTAALLSASRRTSPLPEGFAELVQAMRETQAVPEHLLRASDDPLEVRVARGVALLDEQVPEWASRIEVARLDVRSPSCILGQLFGTYIDGHIALALGPILWLEGMYHGFITSMDDSQAANNVEGHWRVQIAARAT